MARKTGALNKPKKTRFKPYEGRKQDDIHIRLTKDMMMDPAYLGLSSSAKVLYGYMKLWAGPDINFTCAASLAKNHMGMSKPTFIKSRDELIEKGFIDFQNKNRARTYRETGEYEFSDRWRGS